MSIIEHRHEDARESGSESEAGRYVEIIFAKPAQDVDPRRQREDAGGDPWTGEGRRDHVGRLGRSECLVVERQPGLVQPLAEVQGASLSRPASLMGSVVL